MKDKFSLAAPFVIILGIGLMGCEPNGKVDQTVILPHIPTQYRACAQAQLTKIPGGQISRADIVKLIADLRKSELNKDTCLKGLVRWYDKVAATYARPR